MENKTKERWLELCEQAAVEQDHDKLMQLVSEIDRLLAEKEQRLKAKANKASGSKTSNEQSL
jgi:hypothetical protein